eukprot:scaffold18419_cov98-Isochrysis_galbana.AAC.4
MVADGHVSAPGGGWARVRGVVSGWRRVEAAVTPSPTARTSGCRWEPGDGKGARFIIPAGARRRLTMATTALVHAGGCDLEAWGVAGRASGGQ